MTQDLCAFVAIALLVLAVAAITTIADLPACAYEDSMNCIWLADRMGNGSGQSFIDIAGRRFPI